MSSKMLTSIVLVIGVTVVASMVYMLGDLLHWMTRSGSTPSH